MQKAEQRRAIGLTKWLAALIGLATATTAAAQTGQWAYGTPADENWTQRVTITPSGGAISTHDSFVTLTDVNGDIDWMLSFDNFYPQAVINTADGGFATAGTYVEGQAIDVVLVKLKTTGMVEWMHRYPAYNLGSGVDLIETSSGDFIIATEALDSAGLRQPEVIRAKFDGSPIWMHRYYPGAVANPLGEFAYVQEEFDNTGKPHLVLVGSLGQHPGNSDTLIVRLDMNGNVMDENLIGEDAHTDFGRGLKRALEGGFLVTGYSKQFGEGGGTYLMHIKDDLSLDWYQGIYGFSGGKEIYQDSNYNAYLGGSLSYPNPIENMVLLSINTLSQSFVMGRQYGGSENDVATDFDVDANGFTLFGTTRSFDIAPNKDCYLVKTDLNGWSGCNESAFDTHLLTSILNEFPPLLTPIPLEAVIQKLPEPMFAEYHEDNICDDDCVCVIPPSGMVAWWTLDETAGTTAAESIAANDGTHMGGATPAPGMVANGIQLYGTGDYVSAPATPLLEVPEANPNSNTGNISIDAWVYVDGAASLAWAPLVDKRAANGGPGYSFYIENSRLHMQLRDQLGAVMVFQSSQFISANVFTHVAVVVDRTSTYNVRFFVDAVQDIDPQSMTVLGSLEDPDAEIWIGGARYLTSPNSGAVYMNGIIDEVEIFNRALHPSDIQAIYGALECGKCKFDCHVPWDLPFCANELKIVVPVTVCNYSPLPQDYMLSFLGMNASDCGSINGPTVFSVISPSNPVNVAGNSCVTVQVSIERPAGMTSLYDVGCYEVTVTNMLSNAQQMCRGSVQDRRDLCPDFPDPKKVDWLVPLEPGVVQTVSFEFLNTGNELGNFVWRALVYDENMEPSENIGINNNDPGQYAGGELEIPLGERGILNVELLARQFEGLDRSDLVIFTQSNDTLVPLVSRPITTVVPQSTPCRADLNGDGKVDGADLAMLLGSWGVCDKACPADFNDDGQVNGADLAYMLGSWGNCA